MKTSRTHSFKKDKDAKKVYKVTTEFNFEGVTAEQIAEWATSHLVINRQRVLRTKADAELSKMELSGDRIMAVEAGKGATVDVAKAFVSKFSTLDRKAQDEYIAMLDELRKQGKGIADLEDEQDEDEE